MPGVNNIAGILSWRRRSFSESARIDPNSCVTVELFCYLMGDWRLLGGIRTMDGMLPHSWLKALLFIVAQLAGEV
jgi:hypothetical protein